MNIKNMTIEEKVGQMLMFAFHGTEMNEQLAALIEDLKVGGVIHFGRNIANIKQVYELNMAIQNASQIPLFIGLDQEGGPVLRISNEVTPIPGAMTLSSSASLEDVKKVSRISGKELRALGFNMNFAPVGDINNNPDNPVINSRSYSDKPNVVASFVQSSFKGLQESLILPTVKHFPGHGNTSVDSHLDLPIMKESKESLYQNELHPFKQAIDNGIDGVMMSHVLYTSLDDAFPASLSHSIITGILKEEFKFNGLCVTDSLTMKAISNKYTKEEVVYYAVMAGIDLLIFCGSACLSDQKHIKKIFLKLVNDGKIPISRIDESVEKILRLKQKYQIDQFNEDFESVKDKIAITNDVEFVSDLYDNSMTMVRESGILPVKTTDRVLIIFPKLNTATLTEVDSNEYITLSKYLIADELIIDDGLENLPNVDELNQRYDKIIFCTYNVSRDDYQQKLYQLLNKEKLVVVALRSPYDLRILNDAKNYICIYEPTKIALKTLAKALRKEIEFKGTLPINIL